MKTKLNIPKTITVGYQNRSDTYTKKLAYVIYTDDKGVLRKENSWQSWRDKKLEPDTYDNVPTSGFVLNKKVGDYRGGWNGRLSWIRIYDPRGFEFEIKVDNLLFILEECSSIKGKGLEGEFVYSWDGPDLVLLPSSSNEYTESSKFTTLQTKKITKNDINEGWTYLNKDNDKVIYLGRLDYTECANYWYGEPIKLKTVKKHIFAYVDKEGFWIQPGFTKLGEIISEEINENYSSKFDEYKNSFAGGYDYKLEFIESNLKNKDTKDSRFYGFNRWIKRNDEYVYTRVEKELNKEEYGIYVVNSNYDLEKMIYNIDRSHSPWWYNRGTPNYTVQDLSEFKFYTLCMVCKSNGTSQHIA